MVGFVLSQMFRLTPVGLVGGLAHTTPPATLEVSNTVGMFGPGLGVIPRRRCRLCPRGYGRLRFSFALPHVRRVNSP